MTTTSESERRRVTGAEIVKDHRNTEPVHIIDTEPRAKQADTPNHHTL